MTSRRLQLRKGDALRALRSMPAASVQLVYVDPPFYSGRDWTLPDGRTAFSDVWPSREAYAQWLGQLVASLHRVLARNGSIYVHLDPKIEHIGRAALDEVFGWQNFMRAITWRIGWVSGYKSAASSWIRNHDSLLYYVKDRRDYVFHKSYSPYPEGYRRRSGKPGRGLPLEDVWNVGEHDRLDSIQIKSLSREKTGYPTQKPVALLERIVASSSNPNDRVLDPCCGSGTTGIAALRLGRRAILIDSSPVAIATTRRRLAVRR
jgi:DNA modification methylase